MQDDTVQPSKTSQNSPLQDDTQSPTRVNPYDDASALRGVPHKPNTSVSTPNKEVSPRSSRPEPVDNVTEYFVRPSEQEPKIEKAVENAGVKAVSEPKISPEAIKSGVTLAKEATPVATSPTGRVKLPMNKVEAERDAKGDPTFSLTWLAKLILVYLKKGGADA